MSSEKKTNVLAEHVNLNEPCPTPNVGQLAYVLFKVEELIRSGRTESFIFDMKTSMTKTYKTCLMFMGLLVSENQDEVIRACWWFTKGEGRMLNEDFNVIFDSIKMSLQHQQ